MSNKKLTKRQKKILRQAERKAQEARDRIESNHLVQQAREPKRPKNLSKQDNDDKNQNAFRSITQWVTNPLFEEVPYTETSSTRDAWLRKFWKLEPHIAGILASVTSIDKNRAWRLVGPERLVNQYNRILRYSNDGDGWRSYMSQQSLAYYTSDLGAVTEIGRSFPAGPLRALYHVDPVQCQLKDDRDYPIEYNGTDWAWYDYFRSTSMISTDQDMLGLGFCAISRCYELAKLMIAVYEHDQEKLGARAPKGLLLLKNITQDQWDEAMNARQATLDSKMQQWYGGVAVLAQLGFDSVDAKMVALSELPEAFNLRDFTDLVMYGYALAFGYDPVEFWPVQSGALGRGKEAEVQHLKATGKGGADLMLTYQDQLQLQLPESLLFEFEHRDPEGMLLEAEIAKLWAETAELLHNAGMGVLTRQQAASLLAQHAIIPDSWTVGVEELTKSAESTLGDDPSADPSTTSPGGAPYDTPIEPTTAYPDTIEQLLDTSASIRRSILDFPNEPIVQYSWPKHTIQLLWHPDRDHPQPLKRNRTYDFAPATNQPHQPHHEDHEDHLSQMLTSHSPIEVIANQNTTESLPAAHPPSELTNGTGH